MLAWPCLSGKGHAETHFIDRNITQDASIQRQAFPSRQTADNAVVLKGHDFSRSINAMKSTGFSP
jgi:hypothetical protein